MSYFS